MAFLINNYKITEYKAEDKQKIFEIPFYFKDKKDIYFLVNEKSNIKESGRYKIIENNLIFNDYLEKDDNLIIFRKKEISQVVNYLSNAKINVNMLKSETENIYLIIQDIYENTFNLTNLEYITKTINNITSFLYNKISEKEFGIDYLANKYDTREGVNDFSFITPETLEYTLNTEIKPFIKDDISLPDEIGDYYIMNEKQANKRDDLIKPLGQILPVEDYKELSELDGYLLEESIKNINLSASGFNLIHSEIAYNPKLAGNTDYLYSLGKLYKKNINNNIFEEITLSGDIIQNYTDYCFYNKDKTKLIFNSLNYITYIVDLETNIVELVNNSEKEWTMIFSNYNTKLDIYISLVESFENNEIKYLLCISEDECRTWVKFKEYQLKAKYNSFHIFPDHTDYINGDFGSRNYKNGKYYINCPQDNKIYYIDENNLEGELGVAFEYEINDEDKIYTSHQVYNTSINFYNNFAICQLSVTKDSKHNFAYTKDGGENWILIENYDLQLEYEFTNDIKFNKIEPISNNSFLLLNKNTELQYINVDTLELKTIYGVKIPNYVTELYNVMEVKNTNKIRIEALSFSLDNTRNKYIHSYFLDKTYEPSVNIKIPDFSNLNDKDGKFIWTLKAK